MQEKLKTLKEHGRTICNNTVLLPNGTIKAGRDCTFVEKLSAIYIYKFIDNKIYKI
jgi:hypothetical protein